MKFFMVLLAVGLSASEKLDRTYLPPPGAKIAGGNSEDLQTPLEYPKETLIVHSENGAKDRLESDFDVKTETPDDEKVLPIATKTFYGTPAYLSGFKPAVIPMSLELENTVENSQNGSPSLKYPLNGKYTEKEGIFYYWNNRDHLGRPGNMPIIAIPKGIMENYEPKAFGMYGGNPMIIKSYSETPQNLLSVNKFDNISTSDETFSPNSQKSVMYNTTRIQSKPNLRILPEVTQFIAVTAKPTFKIVSQKNDGAQNYLQKRPERPQPLETTAAILNFENILSPERFIYSFDTSNGIHLDEKASTLDGVRAQGSYSYTGDDGRVYSITYSADENGFQPKGDHLPTPPPIPKAIQKVIEQAKRDKEAGISHDGSYDEEKYGHMKYQGPVNRYLHNKQERLGVNNRNRVLRPRKMKKPVPIKNLLKEYEPDNIKEKNAQQSYVLRPANHLNGHYGLKRVQSVQRNKVNLINSQNEEKSSRRQLIEVIESDNLKPRFQKPSVPKLYFEAKKNELRQGSRESNIRYKDSNNYQIIRHLNSMTSSRNSYRNQVATKSSVDESKQLKITASENGYYYVPPRNIFIEGKFQDKPSLDAFSGKNTTNSNLDIKSVPVTGFYNVDQNDYIDKFPEKSFAKITSYFTTTEEPLNLQTYGSDFYENTNHEVNQSIEAATEITSNENIVTVTTVQPYGYFLSTNPYDQAYEDIAHQEDTVFPENSVKSGFPSTKNDMSIANFHSTTPMPSQMKYKSQPLGDLNQYETTYPPIRINNMSPSSATNYAANEGYFRTIPAIPETFEDLPTSTYKPIYTVDRFQTEQTPNIKVDGYGRPIQDTSSFNTYSPRANGYNTNGLPSNGEFRTNGEIRSTVSYSGEYEEEFKGDKATKLEDNKTTSGILSNDFMSGEGKAALNYFDNEKVTSIDKTLGEDFSGPKQPQRYDAETGYFY